MTTSSSSAINVIKLTTCYVSALSLFVFLLVPGSALPAPPNNLRRLKVIDPIPPPFYIHIVLYVCMNAILILILFSDINSGFSQTKIFDFFKIKKCTASSVKRISPQGIFFVSASVFYALRSDRSNIYFRGRCKFRFQIALLPTYSEKIVRLFEFDKQLGLHQYSVTIPLFLIL